VAKVAGLSLYVFVSLLNGFKDHLKAEVEVFITNIFLRLLESENSSYEHKSKVLEVFHSICKDHDALVRLSLFSLCLCPSGLSLNPPDCWLGSPLQIELFLNYDCDLEGIDLFRRIVDAFGKIAKVR
jgi:brefeldin A-inhibited guanine nucleotide-exchange protein